MDVTYQVVFKGLPEKSGGALEKMLREDLSKYPDRISMITVSVAVKKPDNVTKGKFNAKPR